MMFAPGTLDVDAWGLDVVIGGSQKSVMIPPGLSYASISDKACCATRVLVAATAATAWPS